MKIKYSRQYFIPVFMGLLLSLFFIELLSITQQQMIIPWTELLANMSSSVLVFFDSNAISQGVLLQDKKTGFAVSIQPGCNGIEASIVLISAIIAYPSTLYAKIAAIVLGFMAVQSLNVVRIISLFYLGQWDIEIFEWAHLYIWQALIMLDVLIVFILWLRFLHQSPLNQSQTKTKTEKA